MRRFELTNGGFTGVQVQYVGFVFDLLGVFFGVRWCKRFVEWNMQILHAFLGSSLE